MMKLRNIKKSLKYYLIRFEIIPPDPFQEILEKILLDLPNFKIEVVGDSSKFLRKSFRLNDTLNNIDCREIHIFDISDGQSWRTYSMLKK